MIIIKLFTDFCNDENSYKILVKNYNWNLDKNYNVKYKFTYGDDYTHAILFNCPMPKLNIDKNNVIGLAQEPNCFLNINNNFIKYCIENLKKYYIGNLNYKEFNLKYPFIEKFSYCLPFLNYKNIKINHKTKLMNYVYSRKNNNINTLYSYRHLLGKNILENNLNIDIYGSSTNNLKKIYNKENIKYSFDWDDVYNVYKDYKFSIVIENIAHPEYFTEKIMIPLLCGCIPIYLGCSNIDNYFKKYVIHLKGNINEDIKIIKDILDNPDKYYKEFTMNDLKYVEDTIHLKNLINKEFL